MDVHSRKRRSYNMSKIKGKNTKPELLVRKWLWTNGYRYRIHYKNLPGKPDIVFPGRKKVIFVHGCFWHKHNCQYFKWPQSNVEFWHQKIEDNVRRDRKNIASLITLGWNCLIFWECTIKNIKKSDFEENFQKVGHLVEDFLISENNRNMEIDATGMSELIIPFGEFDE